MKATAYLFFVVFWIGCAPIHLFAQQQELVSRLYAMTDGLPEQGINGVPTGNNPKLMISMIFQPFFTTKPTSGSTGLGLHWRMTSSPKGMAER